MGSSDNFCLRWNDFEANISTSFRELRQDSEFFDVTLCCDNGTDVVQAHKVILAACSPLFRRILARQKNLQHPFLYLKGIRLRELTSVLNFMYHGEVNVAQDSLNGFLAVAEELAVKGLTTDSKPSSYEDAPRRKATAKRKTQSTSGLPKRAKVDDEDDEESGPGTAAAAGGGTDPVDVKSIKAEPEVAVATASGSGAGGPDESFTGDDGADNGELYGSGTGGGGAEGDDFDSFGQYGEGEFDDSSSGAPASGTGADGKDGMEEAVFLKSQYGNPILMDNLGHCFCADRKTESKIYWKCTGFKADKCKARAKTEGFYIIGKFGHHTHPPSAGHKQLRARNYPARKKQAEIQQQIQQVQQQVQQVQLQQYNEPMPQQQQQQQPPPQI